MSARLSHAERAVEENLEQYVDRQNDPATYKLNVGLLSIAKGIAELEIRIQRLEAAVLQMNRDI
jgi:hypothetical protein